MQEVLQLPPSIGDDDRQLFEAVFQGKDPDDNRNVAADDFVNQVLQRLATRPERHTPPATSPLRAAVISEAETTRAQLARLAMQVEHNMSLTASSIRPTHPPWSADGGGGGGARPQARMNSSPERTFFIGPTGRQIVSAGPSQSVTQHDTGAHMRCIPIRTLLVITVHYAQRDLV